MIDIIKAIDLLEKEYPEGDCSLVYENPLELLISVILSAQCTDERVNIVTPALFKRYRTAKDFAEADLEELSEYIRSCGFYNSKGKNIIECCKRIVDVYDGKVPDTMEDLTSLAGVGRKTANLILGDIYGRPSYVVDTHCKRISKRMGLTKETDPEKVEMDLRKIIPPEKSGKFCHRLVLHGRAVCTARNAKCDICCLKEICPKKIS